jgi:hypothetical protein
VGVKPVPSKSMLLTFPSFFVHIVVACIKAKLVFYNHAQRLFGVWRPAMHTLRRTTIRPHHSLQ